MLEHPESGPPQRIRGGREFVKNAFEDMAEEGEHDANVMALVVKHLAEPERAHSDAGKRLASDLKNLAEASLCKGEQQ